MRRGIDPQVTSDTIIKMRRTQKGDLLIDIIGGAGSIETVRTEVARSLGEGVKIRKLENMSPVEIRDLDKETSKEEVLNAVSNANGDTLARVVSIRKAYEGCQIAVVVLLL